MKTVKYIPHSWRRSQCYQRANSTIVGQQENREGNHILGGSDNKDEEGSRGHKKVNWDKQEEQGSWNIFLNHYEQYARRGKETESQSSICKG